MMTGPSLPQTRRLDVGAQRVAATYARSLLGAAEKAGVTQQVADELDAVIAQVLDRHPRLEAILASRLIPPDEKLAMLDRLFSRRVEKLLLNALKVVARHGRLELLRGIHAAFHAALDALRGRVHVEVRSTGPLAPQTVAYLSDRVRRALGGEPRLALREQPDLIAGIVLRIGDTVYDGSVATQLREVRHDMIQRSVHEIQCRRDQFRHPGGN
jgi:F-type H+-transporting ATPase subunit delta